MKPAQCADSRSWLLITFCFADFVMHNMIRCLLCCLGLIAFSACSAEGNVSNGAKEPLAAYKDFLMQLRACGNNQAKAPAAETCDKSKIWDAIDVQSKSQFLDAYAALARMDRIIEVYFDPIEHKYMRSKTGTDILKEKNINGYVDLFNYIFKPETLVFNDETESGMSIEKDVIQNENMVTLHTHANEDVVMIKESDGVWRTSGLLNYINIALEPIFASETAMQEYAKGNLETEIKRRTKVKEYFEKRKKGLK